MPALRRWRAALRAWLRRDEVDRDLHTELSHWIDEVTARYQAIGLPAVEARRRALAEMGGVDSVKERVRDVRPRSIVDAMLHDALYACRSLIRSPGLCAAIVTTLALGVGANTAVYSVIRTVLLQPPPYQAPERLALLWGNMGVAGVPRSRLAGPEVVDFRAAATKLKSLAAIQSLSAALTGAGDPEQLRIGHVSWNFFDVLGVGAVSGRTFTEEDGGPSPAPPVLASWPFFQRRFGGEAAAIGRRLVLNGTPVTLIGVLPKDFRLHFPADAGVPDDLQLFQPFGTDLARGHRLIRYYRVIARLADGATMSEAAREVESIGAELARRFPDYVAAKHTFSLTPLLADGTREVRPMLLALLGGVLAVLMTACVNVAGLLLARAASRRRELATLVALGADWKRLARQFVIEGLFIAGTGAVAGVGTGFLVLRALIAMRPPGLDRLEHATIDAPVLIAVALVTCVWGLLFALAPMMEFGRLSHAAGFNGPATSDRLRYRTRATLVVAQVALSTVLVVVAGLLVRTMDALHRVDAGFDREASAVTFRLALPAVRYPTSVRVNAFSRELESRLRALPGVQQVGAISQLPFDEGNLASKYFTETSERKLALARAADARYVSPGALPALGLRLMDGRWFAENDDPESTPAVVVDERLANMTWPGGRAVGQRLHLPLLIDRQVTTMWTTVIGVVRHVRHRTPDAEVQEQVYLSFRQNLRDPMAYVVRTDGDPALLAAHVRSVVSALDSLLPVYDIASLESRVDRSMSGRRFTALLITSFAFLALTLAAVGLAGLATYSVAVRQREFGIRLALGSTPASLRAKVLGESLALVSAGIVVGIAGAAVAANVMASLFFGVGPADPASYGNAIAMLFLVAVAATWAQARRASAVNPAEALRSE